MKYLIIVEGVDVPKLVSECEYIIVDSAQKREDGRNELQGLQAFSLENRVCTGAIRQKNLQLVSAIFLFFSPSHSP